MKSMAKGKEVKGVASVLDKSKKGGSGNLYNLEIHTTVLVYPSPIETLHTALFRNSMFSSIFILVLIDPKRTYGVRVCSILLPFALWRRLGAKESDWLTPGQRDWFHDRLNNRQHQERQGLQCFWCSGKTLTRLSQKRITQRGILHA